ncbi:MAG: hypothetical protein HC797_00905 [Anaerolineales bacterium]|nr:hypothetical protein [Anaerolineales bacterium]
MGAVCGQSGRVECHASKGGICRDGWAAQWKERLERTPIWLSHWLHHQTDDDYWRVASLSPDYKKIICAVYTIGGWMDSYVNGAVRMFEKCANAPRKCLIGNWNHQMPDHAYPGPNLDYLREMDRFLNTGSRALITASCASLRLLSRAANIPNLRHFPR